MEIEIINSLTNALSKVRYGQEPIFIEIVFAPIQSGHYPDLLIKAGKRTLAVVEIKKQSSLIKQSLAIFSLDFFYQYNTRYYVITNGEEFIIFDRFEKANKSTTLNIDKFVQKIKTQISSDWLRKVKNRVAEIFSEVSLEYDNSLPGISDFLKDSKTKIFSELRLSSKFQLFFKDAKKDVDSFEHTFFRTLLNNNVSETVYRYCSFSRSFQILNDNEIAMQGLPGMNDTTEPNYVDNYLNSSSDDVWEMSDESRAAINRRFILSCTTLRDSLLPWRLYGDDGKGVCIELEAKENLRTSKKFYLGSVKYADGNGTHFELELLKKIIERIRQEFTLEIRFVLLYVWRHFFKPHAYEYEKEVRLLYIHSLEDGKKMWLIAQPFEIINPFFVFKLNEAPFPLRVAEIILGPKKAEVKLNISQLTQMFKNKKIDCKVSESNVKVYR
jgi:hypothetical protein